MATTTPPFDNIQRTRYYGIRVGDIVSARIYNLVRGEVVAYGFMDNNCVQVKTEDGEMPCVAEYLTIIAKAEDISPSQ